MNGIIGTAGHIDHGKTALVGALTGEDTDRLPEERARGISIDLGFSHLELDGLRLGVVDVPGHEDFIRNMVAGATGIDVLLLVIAADEGVMPQTREHTAIAELLGVRQAVVALTKVDRVESEWLTLVRDEVGELLAGTSFPDAPVVPTSAVTGEGLDELRHAIRRAFVAPRGRSDDLFRLPVDRVFTVRGTGTVVTGTVWSGSLAADASVRLLPGGPTTRVRGLEVHGEPVDRIEAGQRAAIALAGVDRDDVDRGMAVVAGDGWCPTSMLTARLRVLPGPGWSVAMRQRVRVHLGTAEVMARAVPLTGPELAPGDDDWVQLRLEAPVTARAGDRFVVRSYSPVTTIAGGVVAEPIPPRRTRIDAGTDRLLQALVRTGQEAVEACVRLAGGGGVPVASLPVRAGTTPAVTEAALDAVGAVLVGAAAFPGAVRDDVERALLTTVSGHHDLHPLQPGIDPEGLRQGVDGAAPALVQAVLDSLLDAGQLRMVRGRVAEPGFEPTLTDAQASLQRRILRVLADAGAAPPRLAELEQTLDGAPELPELMELLEADGRVARIEHDLFMEREALDGVVRQLRSRFGGRSGVRPSEVRDLLGVSRRHLMPLLAHLDREGVTVRSGEGRAVLSS